MAKQKKKPVVELNDDINWDYNSYRGRSKRQVSNNGNIAFYVILAAAGFVIGMLFHWILSNI
jgi:hypothetical protein